MTRFVQPYLAHLAHPEALTLFAVFLVLWVLALVARFRRNRALARFGSRAALRTLTAVGRWRRFVQSFCFSTGLTVLIIAIAGPCWDVEPQPLLATGRDLVVVLDLSRSMLAEDAAPNRLLWAKQALTDFTDRVRRQGGHRLALVAFAGQARVVCPLTPDYDHFREALTDLNPADARLAPRPGDEAPTSGTRIGLALKQAVQLHDPRFRDHQDILLVSDGDDPARDADWGAGAAEARSQGIPVSVLGVGSPFSDSEIPGARGKPLVYAGRKVQTRLQEATLEEIARLTGGVYRSAWNEPAALRTWYREWIQARPGREIGDDLLPTYRPQFAWFFGTTLALLALATIISERPRPPCRREEPDAKKASARLKKRQVVTELKPALVGLATAVVAYPWWLVPLAVLLVSAAPVWEAEQHVRAANDAFARGDFEAAVALFTRAEEWITDPGLVAANKAAALYRLGRYREAELHYLRGLEDATGERRARLLYDLGNALVQESGGRDAGVLDRAVRAYEECLGLEGIAAELREDARHNLQLARVLRAKAKERKKDSHSDSDPKKQRPDERPGQPQPSGDGRDMADTLDPNGGVKRPVQAEPGKDGDGQGGQQRAPGTGNLPPVPDSDQMVPLAPEDAAAHLRLATGRILEEQRQQQQTLGRPTRNVLDW